MATHSSILAWRIPMDRGTWWATVKTALLGGKSSKGILQDTGRPLIQVTTIINPPWPPSPVVTF